MGQFSNAGLARAEAMFVGAHPRAAQYLEQAPVLVMWAYPWAAQGEQSGETFAKTWIADLCERGVGLKYFLRAAGYSAPMRQLHSSVILPSRAPVYRMLARMEPTEFARIAPPTAKAQRKWLNALHEWLSCWRSHSASGLRDTDALFRWAAINLHSTPPAAVRDLCDFQKNSAFNCEWGLRRAAEEMAAWHSRITLASQMRGLPVGPDDQIDFGGHADRFEVEPYVLTALRTPRQIAEEGSAMRHCVATYIKHVFDGSSHIVSITKDGKRVATLELGGPRAGAKRWAVLQLKGPRNSPPSATVDSLAAVFSEVMRNPA